MDTPLPREALPEPFSDEFPELVDLYWATWESAWRHVRTRPGAPQSPYMDEGFDPSTIWIWDTCFMAAFCKYGAAVFPGAESFDNFYVPIHEGVPSPLKIQHPDNPPLFAWFELAQARHTGNLTRLAGIWERQYLQKHYAFFLKQPPPRTHVPPFARYHNDLHWNGTGFLWSGVASGMDNTPRGRGTPPHGHDGHERILWFDAMAQQGLAARCMAEIAGLLGDTASADHFRAEHALWRDRTNDLHWDPQDSCYHDVLADTPQSFVRVRTPAAYWPLLAGFCNAEQAASLAALATDPETFGGPVPFPSVARSDPDFRESGHYWRGGVWVPLAYMACKALEENGCAALSDDAALKLLSHMSRTYTEFTPSSIWECYQPLRPEPATLKDGTDRTRPDFCGWSALAPISLFLENVLGLRRVDALAQTVVWDCTRQGRYGLRNLRVGEGVIDLIHTGHGFAEVTCSRQTTLILNGKTHTLVPGSHFLPIQPDE